MLVGKLVAVVGLADIPVLVEVLVVEVGLIPQQ